MNKSREQQSRFAIMVIVLILMTFLLLAQTFKLMIIEGGKYRELSDNKRIKDIFIPAPRGNIYDRNGVLLAGTKPSFTVQLLTDDLKRLQAAAKNDEFLSLVRMLEEDGSQYIEDMPVDLNTFIFADEEEYFTEENSPDDKILKLIVDNNLMPTILRKYSSEGEGEKKYDFIMLNRALNALETRGTYIPIDSRVENGLQVDFNGGESLDEFLKKNNLPADADPIQTVIDLVGVEKTLIRKIINHPVARKLTYDVLVAQNLQTNVQLKKYSLKYDDDFLKNKADLHRQFPEITIDSGAKEDFINITSKDSLKVILEKIEIQKNGELINPAAILIDMIEKKTRSDTGLAVEVKLANETVSIHYEDENESTVEMPMEKLLRLAKESGVIGEFVTDDRIKFLAQEANTGLGILPQISVIEWDYIFVKNKSDLLEKYELKSVSSPEELLFKMREYYKLGEMSDYEALAVISLHRRLESQGHYSYQPVNIAYGIKDRTVARIKERLGNNSGINVSAEPIRFYPEGKTAAHVLGYMGRISQPDEIKKYVDGKSYGPNELIGKTGVEESFETTLRGTDGKRVVEVDSLGNRTSTLKEELPVPGNNVYLTMDLALQKTAENALIQTLEKLQVGGSFESKWGTAPLRINEKEGRPHYNATSGSVVVLDVKTGEVLSLVNEKSYDPNLFATGISNSDWKSLFPDDENNPLADRPLLNIAMQSQIQPGSIFKLCSSLAALEKGFSPYREIEDSGFVEIGDTIFGCWLWNTQKETHGMENVFGAIRDSCNFYYYALALGENPKTGDQLGIKLDLNDIRATSIRLGLDSPTGVEINIPYESGGRIPNPEEKKQTLKALLNHFLEAKLEAYIKPSKKINPVVFENMINEISSWLDRDEPIGYEEISEALENLGIDSEKVLEGTTETLTDIIKYTYVDQAVWNISDTLNVVIGQGQNAYTPLQMANYVSIFANGGYKNKVSVIKEVKSFENAKVLLKNEPIRNKVQLNNDANLGYVREGMNMAAYFGSLNATFGNLPVEVGIKTGTAERDGLNPYTKEPFDDYSWMVAFAPYDDPKIAVAVLLYQAGSGANCAPIVREVVGDYLKLEPNPENAVSEPSHNADEVIE